MNTTVTLAGAFQDIGDHLLGIGTGWSEKALKLALIVIVVVNVVRKFSVKAGIGALLGLVVCLGIYNARNDLGNAFKNEVLNSGAGTTSHVKVVDSAAEGGGAA
ncbi:hypothetical protein [Streptomyces luteireticuli]|uniref:hypothetical protein n=1 Tax=Streptomyces luteireticuli TaxID=173858 RepID=UPI003558C95C